MQRYMPAPCLSVVTNDCISNAKDYNAGGARYNTNYIQGVGIGTISDCLAAVKYNVYRQEKLHNGRADRSNGSQLRRIRCYLPYGS